MNLRELVIGLDDPQRSWHVQMALIQWGEKAVEPLIEFLIGPPTLDPHPRCLAVQALGIIGGEKAIEGLIRVLSVHDVRHHDPYLRISEEAVKNCAAEQLGKLGDRKAVEPLLDALKRFHLANAALALAAFREKRAVPLVIDCLEDAFIRERMVDTLLAFGSEAVEPLIQTSTVQRSLYGEETKASIERRAEATRLLGELKASRVVQPLLFLLEDEAEAVRLQAALALTKIVQDDRIDRALLIILASLGTKDLLLQSQCLDALCRAGSRAIPYLVGALRAKAVKTGNREIEVSDETRLLILEALVQIGGRRAFEGIGQLVSDANKRIRLKALKALGKLGWSEGIPSLVAALQDRDPSVRAAVIESLGLIGSVEAVEALVLAAGDRDKKVREKVRKALVRCGKKAVEPIRSALGKSVVPSFHRRRQVKGLEAVLKQLLEEGKVR